MDQRDVAPFARRNLLWPQTEQGRHRLGPREALSHHVEFPYAHARRAERVIGAFLVCAQRRRMLLERLGSFGGAGDDLGFQ
jgi:hypothetical protein